MKAVLLNGTEVDFDGANVQEVSVSIFDDVICVVLFDGTVYEASSLETTKSIRR